MSAPLNPSGLGRPRGMSLQKLGIVANDFNNNMLADFGRTITIVPVTEVKDAYGHITKTYSGTTTINAVFMQRSHNYERKEDGEQITAPAYLLHKSTSTVKKGDMIISGTGTFSTWLAFDVIDRPNRDNIVYKYSPLFHEGEV